MNNLLTKLRLKTMFVNLQLKPKMKSSYKIDL